MAKNPEISIPDKFRLACTVLSSQIEKSQHYKFAIKVNVVAAYVQRVLVLVSRDLSELELFDHNKKIVLKFIQEYYKFKEKTISDIQQLTSNKDQAKINKINVAFGHADKIFELINDFVESNHPVKISGTETVTLKELIKKYKDVKKKSNIAKGALGITSVLLGTSLPSALPEFVRNAKKEYNNFKQNTKKGKIKTLGSLGLKTAAILTGSPGLASGSLIGSSELAQSAKRDLEMKNNLEKTINDFQAYVEKVQQYNPNDLNFTKGNTPTVNNRNRNRRSRRSNLLNASQIFDILESAGIIKRNQRGDIKTTFGFAKGGLVDIKGGRNSRLGGARVNEEGQEQAIILPARNNPLNDIAKKLHDNNVLLQEIRDISKKQLNEQEDASRLAGLTHKESKIEKKDSSIISPITGKSVNPKEAVKHRSLTNRLVTYGEAHASKMWNKTSWSKTKLGKLGGGAGSLLSTVLSDAQPVYITNPTDIANAMGNGGNGLGIGNTKIPTPSFLTPVVAGAVGALALGAAFTGVTLLTKKILDDSGINAKIEAQGKERAIQRKAEGEKLLQDNPTANAEDILNKKYSGAWGSIKGIFSSEYWDARRTLQNSETGAILSGKGYDYDNKGSSKNPLYVAIDGKKSKLSEDEKELAKTQSDAYSLMQSYYDKKLNGKKISGEYDPELAVGKSDDSSLFGKIKSFIAHPIESIRAYTSPKINVSNSPSDLGSVSKMGESGKSGPGTINAKSGFFGGPYYGSYQISKGNMDAFLKHSGYGSQFAGLKAGSTDFNSRWQQVAASDPANFEAAQKSYIINSHYEPQLRKLSSLGLDVNNRAIQEMAFSNAVQNGPDDNSIINAIKATGRDPKTMSVDEVIDAVQNYKVANVNKQYRSSSPEVRYNIAMRHDTAERQRLHNIGSQYAPEGTVGNIRNNSLSSLSDIGRYKATENYADATIAGSVLGSGQQPINNITNVNNNSGGSSSTIVISGDTESFPARLAAGYRL